MALLKRYSIVAPLIILGVLSLLFRIFPWDMQLADAMHSPTEGWNTDSTGFWQFLYEFGVIPAVLTTVFAFVLLMLGIRHPLRRYRKQCLYLISCLLVGPGLITNGILKEFWGRPRPKQIADFGGEFPYEPLLTIDPISTGKSFPCGHATMGFFFFALAFIIVRSRVGFHFTALLALIFGLLIGYARLVQGGHFPSDTVWAAAVCWFSSLGLYYAFGLHQKPFLEANSAQKRPWWMLPSIIAGVFAIILSVSLATPYQKTRSKTHSDSANISQIIVSVKGPLEIVEQEGRITFQSEGSGHRLPKSRHHIQMRAEGEKLSITLKKTGFFTELNLRNKLYVPPGVKVKQEDVHD